MFTGIIQEVGVVRHVQKQGDGLLIKVEAPDSSANLKKGGSINISGACLSVVNVSYTGGKGGGWFETLATAETIARTNFRLVHIDDRVNLELPLTLNDPLGGHLVSGHVDDTGRIETIKPGRESTIMRIVFEAEHNRYLIEKGSIAVDGISLTAFNIESGRFSVSLIPDTIERTNLKFRKINDVVNLEFDQIGKYVENFLNTEKKGLTMDFMKKHGY